MTQQRPSRAARRSQPAAAAAQPDQDKQLLPVGRQRGADPNRMIAHLTRMNAEKDQQLAATNALVDELEEALAAEQEANAGLRAELVQATSGRSDSTS